MTKTKNFYIVARGVWTGNPAKYKSLQSAVKGLTSGNTIRRMEKDVCSGKPGVPRIVQQLSLKKAMLDGTTARVEYSAIPESEDQPYFLIRTYNFSDSWGYWHPGYEVTEYADLKGMFADTNKQIKDVENQRSILTQGLELLVVEGD